MVRERGLRDRLDGLMEMERSSTHVFASDLILSELHLDERAHRGEELPPGPALHSMILLDVLLNTADGQVLDLLQQRERERERERGRGLLER